MINTEKHELRAGVVLDQAAFAFCLKKSDVL
jgi:hypothetical protein